jgi:large subunit ribosomal protein L23
MTLKLIRAPHLTEKTVAQKEAANQVTFLVDPGANKTEIKKAVESLFKVKVEAVNTINSLGKIKRMGRFTGKQQDFKKAIITLKAGDKIEYFEGT